MVGTIGSVGHGASGSGRRTWRKLLFYYGLGSVLGGAVLGGVTGTFALALDSAESIGLPSAAANSLGILALTLVAVRDLGGVPIPLPSRDRQVPMAWKRLPGHWSPFIYGFSLGTGVSTAIYLGSFYATLIVAILMRDFLLALVLGLVFAVSRGILVPISAWTKDGPEGLVGRLAPRQRIVAAINGALIGTTAGLLVLSGL